MSAGVTVFDASLMLPHEEQHIASGPPPTRIAIIGAGTVGLSVALAALEDLPRQVGSIELTIIAEHFLEETTSYGSGGLWEPYQIAGTPEEQVNEWGRVSFQHFLSLLHGPEAGRAGVQLLTAYSLFEQGMDTSVPSWKDIVFNYTELDAANVAQMGLPPRFVAAHSFGTLVIEQKYYMQYLMNELSSASASGGGRVKVSYVHKRIDSLQDFVDQHHLQYDAIVNCTGLGAGKLLGKEEDTYPIRGQVLRVKAPWINNVWFFPGTGGVIRYIIPNVDTVVLGGTAQKNNWSTVVSDEDTEDIMRDLCQVFPSLREAPVEQVWVGLRPGRTPLRLDAENFHITSSSTSSSSSNSSSSSGSNSSSGSSSSRSSVPIVHCYGHGGSGITLAYGCAKDVVNKFLLPALREFKGTGAAEGATAGGGAGDLSTWIKHTSRI